MRLQVTQRGYWLGWSKDVELFCKVSRLCKIPSWASTTIRIVATHHDWRSLGGDSGRSRRGNAYILLMDYFSKFVEIIPIANQEATTVAQIIVEVVCCRFGCPLQLLSDRGACSQSHLFRKMCRLMGIDQVRTSYQPRNNRKVSSHYECHDMQSCGGG